MISRLRFWVRSEDGTTAVEFSLLALPMIMMIVGILEISILFASATLLEGAAGSSSRMIRTGQLQQGAMGAGDPAAIFRQSVCDYAIALIDCDDVVIEVREMDSFADFDDFAPEYDADGNLVSQGFNASGSGGRVLVRIGYRYEMMTPFIGPLIAGGDNALQFLSTVVLQNEPYDFNGL